MKTIKDLKSLSSMASAAVLIEEYVRSKIALESLAENVAKSVLNEDADAEAEKQKAKDTDIINSLKNFVVTTKQSLGGKAPNIDRFLDATLSAIDSMDVNNEKFNQEDLNAVLDATRQFGTRFSTAVQLIQRKKGSRPPQPVTAKDFSFNIATKAAGGSGYASVKGAFNPAGFSEDLVNLSASDEGLKILNSIKSAPSFPQPPEKPEENDKPKEKLDFNAVLEKGLKDADFNDAFTRFMETKGLGQINLSLFMKMKGKLIDEELAKKFFTGFSTSAQGKVAFEKIAGQVK